MKFYIPIVAPNFLTFLGRLSPLGKDGIANITLAPFIISREPMLESEETHEGIHVLQQFETGLLGNLILIPILAILGYPVWLLGLIFCVGFMPFVGWFYWLYFMTWAYWTLTSIGVDFKNLTPGQMGYFLIPYEREAYLYDEQGLEYFEDRKWFAWLRLGNEEQRLQNEEYSAKLFQLHRDSHFLGNIFTPKN